MKKTKNLSNKILSDITVFSKYSKYLPDEQRRESWTEIVDRYINMMLSEYPQLKGEITTYASLIYDKKILPSMRGLQFAGVPILRNPTRIYNCAYLPIDDYRAFSETMFLLLGGTGVGYSVQFNHINKLPEIVKPTKSKRFLVGDSIEGWADAVKALVKSYLGYTSSKPKFDFSDIRPKGARLKTAGGKAPGPEPLRTCLFQIETLLDRKENGSKLTSVECHDIECYIADSVLAGGIRRSAMISLFSVDDEEMLSAKAGNWWESNPQRGRANNSAVIVRSRIKKDEWDSIWQKIEASGSGEPGVYFTNNPDWGTNPCCEIALRPFQFCNLCEVNGSDVESQEDFNFRIEGASFFGTLQAGFTDFHYLREVWKKTTEKDALIGVGITGIGSGAVLKLDLKEGADVAKRANEKVSQAIGINAAARVTTVKPSGTSSLVLGTSSGIHAWHNDFYLRSIRLGKNESIYTYLAINAPELLEDDFFKPTTQGIVRIPQKAPEGSILRTESALDLLERTKKFNLEWVRNGHRSGANTNNVSATISLKQEDWKMAGEWMWENKETFNGLSVLPYDNGSYVQAPFEDITEDQYNEKVKSLTNIDLTQVVEIDDATARTQEAACAGGQCEI